MPKQNPLKINSNIPVVHSLHTNLLISNGWVRNGSEYTKGDKKIKYDGVWWWYNGKRVDFLEDIK